MAPKFSLTYTKPTGAGRRESGTQGSGGTGPRTSGQHQAEGSLHSVKFTGQRRAAPVSCEHGGAPRPHWVQDGTLATPPRDLAPGWTHHPALVGDAWTLPRCPTLHNPILHETHGGPHRLEELTLSASGSSQGAKSAQTPAEGPGCAPIAFRYVHFPLVPWQFWAPGSVCWSHRRNSP